MKLQFSNLCPSASPFSRQAVNGLGRQKITLYFKLLLRGP